MNHAQKHKQILENQLSQVAGMPVEITIRGDKYFTLTMNTTNMLTARKVEQYVQNGGAKKTEVVLDTEVGSTFIYIEA